MHIRASLHTSRKKSIYFTRLQIASFDLQKGSLSSKALKNHETKSFWTDCNQAMASTCVY